jgi:hypothetical protein
MKDIIIYIDSSGPNVFKTNITDTIGSIIKNIGNFDYGFYINVDDDNIKQFIKKLFVGKIKDKLIEINTSNESWAKKFNLFFDKYKNLTKYFLICHDDIVIKTKDFFQITLNEISGKENEVGWVTYTNSRYYEFDKKILPNSIREGFHVDRKNYPRIFECHNMNDKIENFDYPKSAVKCHGPYSHINIVSAESLKKIGFCEDWTDYTILIDEDWSLEALKNNLINVWIPSVFYTHPNPKNTALRKLDLRYADIAHKKFYDKWGFTCDDYDDNIINNIRKKYKDTNIPWSSYKKTYEWEYLK